MFKENAADVLTRRHFHCKQLVYTERDVCCVDQKSACSGHGYLSRPLCARWSTVNVRVEVPLPVIEVGVNLPMSNQCRQTGNSSG